MPMKMKKRTFVECKDRIAYTDEMSDEDAWKCWKAILRFQNGLEVWDLPYAVKIVFKHIMNFFIEQETNYQEIVEKRSEAWKKWGRPTKEKTKKANAFWWKQIKTKESKQKLTDTVTDTEIISNEIINNSNELLEDNKTDTSFLNINSDEKIFWKEEINLIIQMISEVNEWALDWSTAKNRQFANHLFRKITKMPKVIEGKIKWREVLKLVITISKDDPYNANKITSPERIYKNWGSLVALARTKFQEYKKKQSDLSAWIF